MDLFDLSVRISADLTDFEQGILRAQKQTTRLADALRAGFAADSAVQRLQKIGLCAGEMSDRLSGAARTLTDAGAGADAFSRQMNTLYENLSAAGEHITSATGIFSALNNTLLAFLNGNITLRDSIAPIWEGICQIFAAAWNSISAVWNGAQTYFSFIWMGIQQIFSQVPMVLGQYFQNAWEAIRTLADGWPSYFDGIWQAIKAVFSTAWQDFSAIGAQIVEGLKNGIRGAWDALVKWVSDLWDELWSGLVDNIPSSAANTLAAPRTVHVTAGSAAAPDAAGVTVIQNIYSEAKTAADLMREARWQQERAVLMGV